MQTYTKSNIPIPNLMESLKKMIRFKMRKERKKAINKYKKMLKLVKMKKQNWTTI